MWERLHNAQMHTWWQSIIILNAQTKHIMQNANETWKKMQIVWTASSKRISRNIFDFPKTNSLIKLAPFQIDGHMSSLMFRRKQPFAALCSTTRLKFILVISGLKCSHHGPKLCIYAKRRSTRKIKNRSVHSSQWLCVYYSSAIPWIHALRSLLSDSMTTSCGSSGVRIICAAVRPLK